MRPAVLGNGSLYLGFDSTCSLREIFWPIVGLHNHAAQNSRNRVVAWFRGHFSEVGDDSWTIAGDFGQGMVFSWTIEHRHYPLSLTVLDCVDPYQSIWVRRIKADAPEGEPLGLYLRQAYNLGENTVGECGFWDPTTARLYHHKGEVWLVSGITPCRSPLERDFGQPVIHKAVAKVRDGGVSLDGTTGDVRGPSIDHGLIESMLGAVGTCGQNGFTMDCFFVLGPSRDESDCVMEQAEARGVSGIVERSESFWASLPVEESVSLKVLLSHADRGGAIVASCDTGVMGDFRDHYRYVWHRDAAMCASTMARLGLLDHVRHFLEFCQRTIDKRGFFWQRYRPDGTIGSGWHPRDLPPGDLPIQEDETSLCLVAAGDYLAAGGSLEFLESIYPSFIEKAAEFTLGYVQEDGTLCRPSFDLWEERRGVFSFTQASCIAGLYWAGVISDRLGRARGTRYREGARRLLDGLVSILGNETRGYCRGIVAGFTDKNCRFDWTEDASLFLIPLLFSGLRLWSIDERLFGKASELSKITWNRLSKSLAVPSRVGPVLGLARYHGDWYERPSDAGDVPGNPWLVTTAWRLLSGLELGLLHEDEISQGIDWFDAVSLPSGVMPEQISCVTSVPLSAAPLAWSHAMFLELGRAGEGRMVSKRTRWEAIGID
ncbi:MAG: glycoside hydrolase family 15 protein [Bacillota bacterium]|jgi:GH15 family glucan-1,4-alpha-glucosidase